MVEISPKKEMNQMNDEFQLAYTLAYLWNQVQCHWGNAIFWSNAYTL